MLRLVLLWMFCAAAGNCLAMVELMDVSKEKAKELGVVFSTGPGGDSGTRVYLQFAELGELKGLMRVELDVSAGGKRVVEAPLEITRAEGKVRAAFSADPAYLAGSVVTIMVRRSERTMIGYRFKVAEFVAGR